MKKVFLLSLGLILGLSAFAQRQVIKNDAREAVAKAKIVAVGNEMTTEASTYAPQEAKSVVVTRWDDMENGETMWTHYDLQSNQYVANRMVQFPNGGVAATATMSHEANQTASDRGTGYNYYDGSDWGDQPETRVESFKTGWPSIAQLGANGEILLAHGNGHMQCFYREVAGEGDWTYVGALPDCPEGYPYAGASDAYPTWPRIVTCGDDHNIAVAVAAIQHSISSDETDVQCVMWRSEDPRDINSWTIDYSPLHVTGWDHNEFSADDYAMAANGHKVALLYSGCLTNSTWLFQSTDDGATWTTTKVWENPYEGRSFEYENGQPWGMEDTLFMTMNGSVVIDNSGVTHVALNTCEIIHTTENESGYYSYYYGRAVDGILYWNDTQEAPIQSPDGNPHHAARLWWPAGDGYVHMEADSTKWIGFIPMYEGIEWNNDMLYIGEYHSKFYGASGHPALCCDPDGNLACAFSSPCTFRNNDTYYFRHIYVSYRSAADGFWLQDEDDLMDDMVFMLSEGTFTMAANNTINSGEFWFGFQSDDQIGFYWGSNATQTVASENTINVSKVVKHLGVEETVAEDVVYNVYPNPAKDYIVVSSSMDANATITFVNIAGQTVKSFQKSLTTGENTISIDLESGVYFCTINANGFNKTVKVVVK